MKHPLQNFDPAITYPRFIENKLVSYLVDQHGLNELAGKFNTDEYREDWEQLAQLIGYSLNGFSELSYVSDDAFKAADLKSEGLTEEQARIKALETTLENIRAKAKELVPEIFHIHPDDLKN